MLAFSQRADVAAYEFGGGIDDPCIISMVRPVTWVAVDSPLSYKVRDDTEEAVAVVVVALDQRVKAINTDWCGICKRSGRASKQQELRDGAHEPREILMVKLPTPVANDTLNDAGAVREQPGGGATLAAVDRRCASMRACARPKQAKEATMATERILRFEGGLRGAGFAELHGNLLTGRLVKLQALLATVRVCQILRPPRKDSLKQHRGIDPPSCGVAYQ